MGKALCALSVIRSPRKRFVFTNYCFISWLVNLAIQTNLKKHIQCMHTDDKPQSCSFCGKQFKNRNTLQNHVSLNHRGYWSCSSIVLTSSAKLNKSLLPLMNHYHPHGFHCNVLQWGCQDNVCPKVAKIHEDNLIFINVQVTVCSIVQNYFLFFQNL